jgi:phospholipid/cholesterol/gamma-HCH transport system substrate-binding protein
VNYAVVGAFVLVLGAALVAGILWIASGGAFQKKYDPYLAIMVESVSGLNLNAPVKYNGVEVGKVRSIELDKAKPQNVRLVFAIERGTPVKQDTVAVLKTQGLTGIAYVELEGGAPESPPLVATAENQLPEIRTKPSLSARLENVLTTALAKMDRMSGAIDALLSEKNQAAFSSALADIATLTRTLAARKDTIDAGIVGAAKTFDNSARISAQLGPVIERIGRSADAIEKLGIEATSVTKTAGKTINTVGGDVQRFTSETLPELERLLGELTALSASLRRLSDQTERNPSSVLFGRSQVPDGPGETSPKAKQP